MKSILSFSILFFLAFIYTNQQKLSLKSYSTDHYPVRTGTWKDLIQAKVECPNNGVLKNFVLQKKNNEFWYDIECYSSEVPYEDYGSAIIKQVILNSNYYYSGLLTNNIKSINNFEVNCLLDYGLNSFQLYIYNNELKRYALCHGLKTTYCSKLSVETEHKSGYYYTSFDALVGVKVGRTDQETDDVIGYPLRGFKYVIDNSRNNYYPTVYYVYAYAKLKNMKVVWEEHAKKFEQQRKSNTQKN